MFELSLACSYVDELDAILAEVDHAMQRRQIGRTGIALHGGSADRLPMVVVVDAPVGIVYMAHLVRMCVVDAIAIRLAKRKLMFNLSAVAHHEVFDHHRRHINNVITAAKNKTGAHLIWRNEVPGYGSFIVYLQGYRTIIPVESNANGYPLTPMIILRIINQVNQATVTLTVQ